MASSLQIRAAGRVGPPRCGQDTECWYASCPPSGSRPARRAGRWSGPPRLRPGPPATPRSVEAARFGLADGSGPSAGSGGLLCEGLDERAAVMIAQPLPKLLAGALARRLGHGPLAVRPAGLDRVQPRALARQAADNTRPGKS